MPNRSSWCLPWIPNLLHPSRCAFRMIMSATSCNESFGDYYLFRLSLLLVCLVVCHHPFSHMRVFIFLKPTFLDTLSQYEPLSRNYVPLHQECERVYGRLNFWAPPSCCSAVKGAYSARFYIHSALHMVYEGASKGCKKLYRPLYSVFPTFNEPDRPVVSAAARLFMLKHDDDIA